MVRFNSISNLQIEISKVALCRFLLDFTGFIRFSLASEDSYTSRLKWTSIKSINSKICFLNVCRGPLYLSGAIYFPMKHDLSSCL